MSRRLATLRGAAVLWPLLLAASAAGADNASGTGAGADSIESADLANLAGAQLATVTVEAVRPAGPQVSPAGTSDYQLGAGDVDRLPQGNQTPLTDALAQLPGVAIDQNQQIHIRDTEGPQFQYQINHLLVPLDINTNPPFIAMLNTLFVQQLDLQVGVLPARYGAATGGVVDIQTKTGCTAPGGEISVYGGQRATVAASLEYAGCSGALGSYWSARQSWSDTAFSSATPGPTPIHDSGRNEQALGYWSYTLPGGSQLALLLAGTRSDNQLPNAPGLLPQYPLAGITDVPPSTAIDSRLDFRDALAMLSLQGASSSGISYQLGYSGHYIAQQFDPDAVGELIYQGVASQAMHADRDHTLQGDASWRLGAHTLATGFYVGLYRVENRDNSLVYALDAGGNPLGNVPERVLISSFANNVVSSVYLSDLWSLGARWSAALGLRGDDLTGYTHAQQLSPRLNLIFKENAALEWHGGYARYLQVPSFLGIAPSAQGAFAGTSAEGPSGIPLPTAETDDAFDGGALLRIGKRLTLSLDNYYEVTDHYLDTGQFGVVPIFAPFNYGHGHMWGSEFALRYERAQFAAYVNVTAGRNWQRGVATGQFNFDPDELAYIDTHTIVLDHQPALGAGAGASLNSGAYAYSLEATYSSGLAGGFADTQTLPQVLQINGSAGRSFLAGRWPVDVRVTVLNLLDRINEIRSAEGIGIFQAAYGPRRTLYATISLRLP